MRGRDVAIIIGGIILVVLAVIIAGGWMVPGMMWWWGQGYGFVPWWGILMMVLMLVFWALVIGGIVWLVLWLIRQGQAAGRETGLPSSRALEILKERYARGEITQEEYERMRREIEDRGE